MAYVPVPKDLTKVKTKVAFNLTKRQIICFTAALILGLPVFFLLKGSTGTSLAAFFMILIMLHPETHRADIVYKKERASIQDEKLLCPVNNAEKT